jgi:hypothetical protein
MAHTPTVTLRYLSGILAGFYDPKPTGSPLGALLTLLSLFLLLLTFFDAVLAGGKFSKAHHFGRWCGSGDQALIRR